MSSATEAQLAALYIMAQEAIYIQIILNEMGHKQPPPPYKQTTPWPQSSMAKSHQNA